MINSKNDYLMRKFLSLSRRPALNFFDLSQIITKLHVINPLCMQTLAEKTTMSKRRLYYYLDVGRLSGAHNVGRSEAEALGWTKIQIIARHVKTKGGASATDIRSFLDLANKSTALMLKRELLGSAAAKMNFVVFQFGPEHREELDNALVAFGAKRTHRGLAEKDEALIRLIRASMLQKSQPF